MENSNIKAEYVFYCDAEIELEDINNISQMSDHVKKYNYGDLVAFSDYRDTETCIIGKEGNLIPNPDYSGSGYLTIPYEITKYLDNAVEKYSNVDASYIDLRHDDKFILENINTKSCKISEKWGWKLTWSCNDYLFVKFPNGTGHDFHVPNTSAYMIKKWYQGSQEEQAEIKVYYEISGESYTKFLKKYGEESAMSKIPSTWSIQHGSGGSGSKNHYSNYTLKGPLKDKNNVINNIKKFYHGFHHVITT